MNEKEILEYRRKSAERLGLTYVERAGVSGYVFPDHPNLDIYDWVPDKDANQMLMIENWLIDSCDIEIVYNGSSDDWDVDINGMDEYGELVNISDGCDESKLIAFAKAFLEYDKQQ